MNATEMRQALRDAAATQRAADDIASILGEMLVGRLRHVSDWTLRQLKRELRKYNPHTKTWR